MLAQPVGDMAADARRTVTARFRVELPEDAWVTEVSRAFPSATLRLLAGYPTDGGAMHLGEATAESPAAVGEAIAAHPDVADYRRLHEAGDRSLARYETAGTGLYAFLDRAGVVIDYPVVVRDGWFVVEFTDTRERFDAFRTGLEAADRRFELLSVVEAVDREDLLTDRQQEAIGCAFRAGYYAVPRDCTLAEVADALDVDTSTASEILRRAEARLVERHLTALRE